MIESVLARVFQLEHEVVDSVFCIIGCVSNLIHPKLESFVVSVFATCFFKEETNSFKLVTQHAYLLFNFSKKFSFLCYQFAQLH